MKNYSETEFQRKTFIMKYTINKDNNEIVIIYADDERQTIPYTVHGELMILEKMKKQIDYYPNFIDNAKLNRLILRLKKCMALLMSGIGTIFLTCLGAGAIALGTSGLFLVTPICINGLIILVIKRKFDEYDDQIVDINTSIGDYNKSMFYLNNEKVFSNERILRDDVITRIPSKVREVVNKRVYLDETLPLINMNNLEDISMRDLKKTCMVSLQSHGPQLVIRPINKKK